MMTSTVKALLTHTTPPSSASTATRNNKVSVIGAGSVGTAIAFAFLAQKITSELVLIDKDESLARGEMLDIQHATMYLDSPLITSSKDYASSANSKICIITAGCGAMDENQKEEAVRKNTAIFKEIIPSVVRHSPDCILIIVSNPVDILTYVAWKLSGFPPHRVIGSGTILESARFRYLISQRLGVSTGCVQAFIIGEQGDSSVPVWSGVSISGVRLREVNQELGTDDDPEDWNEIFKQVIESAKEVERLKDCASWGIALSVVRIANAIFKDSMECFPVSTHITGCRHGVEKDVFMSLPCVIGGNGVVYIVRQGLNEKEKDLLQQSADRMNEIQKSLKIS